MNKDKPKQQFNIQAAQERLAAITKNAQHYSLIIFLVFVAVLYGFIFYRTNTLSSTQPSEDAVSSQVKAAKLPHIDQTVVDQLQSLQDNSVNVQTLFNQARSNPFQ